MEIPIKPLLANKFERFGTVIDIKNSQPLIINSGTTERFHDLAKIDVEDANGKPLLNIFRGQPRQFPLNIEMMERHPLGSQAFYPIQPHDYLVIVSDCPSKPKPNDIFAFKASGTQGVSYKKNIWHHPLLVTVADHDFVVIDRGGPGDNLEEHFFDKTDKNIFIKPVF